MTPLKLAVWGCGFNGRSISICHEGDKHCYHHRRQQQQEEWCVLTA